VQPLVVEEPPQQLSTGEYVAKLEAGDPGVPDVARPLSEEAADFLASGAPMDRLLLLLGEAGSGKSMFTWLTARRLLDEYDACVDAVRATAAAGAGAGVAGTAGSGGGAVECTPPSVVWVPVVVDLKQFKVSELRGLLPRYLTSACGLTEAAVAELREGTPLPGLPGVVPRVLLLCDGFDELQAEESDDASRRVRGALENFAAVVCGGPLDARWGPEVLKVVVTCRESRLAGRADENKVFGKDKHRRRVLLPFNKEQVCAACHVPCAMCHVPCALCRVPCAACPVPRALCRVPCACVVVALPWKWPVADRGGWRVLVWHAHCGSMHRFAGTWTTAAAPAAQTSTPPPLTPPRRYPRKNIWPSWRRRRRWWR
jgi:hypothetical protein